MERFSVGILGATGLVGQRLVELLDRHPWFEATTLAASARSAGRSYAEATRWRLSGDPPSSCAGRIVRECAVEQFDDCHLVLSGLEANVARELEPKFAEAGLAVVSNSSFFRQEPDVPLLVPELNADHLALLEVQQRSREGYIVTNPNCSTTGLALVAAPLDRAFGIRRLVVATLQAISGAGMDGPRALDLVDNVVPYIPGEEEKMESELTKILGTIQGGEVERARIHASAHCHRVPTLDGHLEAVSFELVGDPTPEAVEACLREFRGDTEGLHLPTSPPVPIEVRSELDRPQPRLDRDCGRGMTVVVGRVRRCSALGIKLELLSHNTIRGAAGGTLLNAELLAAKQLLPRRSAP